MQEVGRKMAAEDDSLSTGAALYGKAKSKATVKARGDPVAHIGLARGESEPPRGPHWFGKR